MASSSSLGGKHLVVGGAAYSGLLDIRRNSTGHIVEMGSMSGHMFAWMSRRFLFTYSFLQANQRDLEASGNLTGVVRFLLQGTCDVILGPIGITSFRIGKMDFVHPFHYVPVNYLIPMPDSSTNLSALLKPFDTLVWICLLVTIVAVLLTLQLINWFLVTLHKGGTLKYVSRYVFGLLFGRAVPGVSAGNKSLMIHLVAGTWCMGTFIFTAFYGTLLISFVTLPNPHKLLNNINEIYNRPEISVTTKRGMELFVDPSADDVPILKELTQRVIQGHPKSYCSNHKDCADLVKFEHFIYIMGVDALLETMQSDFVSSKKCNLLIGNLESFLLLRASWALARSSPYLEDFNKGNMEMFEFGLMGTFFRGSNVEAAMKCQKNIKNDEGSGLTLGNFTAAFVVLLIGYSAAFIVLIGELVYKSQKLHVRS